MKRLLAALLGSAALAWASPALAAIGTPVSLGTNDTTSGNTAVALTTTQSCPAGSLLTVEGSAGLTSTSGITVTDSAVGGSNIYAVASTFTTVSAIKALAYSTVANTLASGKVITLHYGGTSATNSRIVAQCTAGIATSSPLDITGTWNSATGTGPATNGNLVTGTLGQASELLISLDDEDTANNVWTADTAHGFTQLTNVTFGGRTAIDYQIVSATTSVTDNPLLAGSALYAVNVFGFKGAAAAGTAGSGMLLRGVTMDGRDVVNPSTITPAFWHGVVTTPATCPNGTTFADNCSLANANGSFQNAAFFSNARQSSQGVYAAIPPYNAAGVNYPLSYDTTLVLKDPSGLPGYTASGSHRAGSEVDVPSGACTDIEGYDFTLHNGTALFYLNSGTTGTCVLKNNKFKNGSNTAVSNGCLVDFGVGLHVSEDIEYNEFDGNYPAFGFACGISSSSTGTSSGSPITITKRFNYVHDMPSFPFITNWNNVIGDTEDNYATNFNADVTLGLHAAFEEGGGATNGQANSLTTINNTILFGSNCPANGTTSHSLLSSPAQFFTYTSVDFELNTSVVNKAGGTGTGCASNAMLEVLHAMALTTVTIKTNYVDPTGSLTSFSNIGDGSSIAGSQSGNTLTVTSIGSGAIYPGTTVAQGGSVTGVIQAYGTSGTSGTGLTGTYAVGGGSQSLTFTTGTTQYTPVTTLVQSGNINMNTGTACTITNPTGRWGNTGC